MHGVDSSAGTVIDTTATGNGGWGFEEESFLGNTYVQPHSALNVLGAYKATGAVSNNLFLNPYAEQGQPPSQIGAQNMVVGGIPQAFDWSHNPSAIQANQTRGMVSTPTTFDSHTAAGVVDPVSLSTNGYGRNDPFGVFVGQNNARGSVASDSISFRRTADGVSGTAGYWGEIDNGWWGFRTAFMGDGPGLYNYPFLMSDPLTTVGEGWGWFPNGFYLGQKNVSWSARRKISVGTAVPPGPDGNLGDIVFDTSPAAGGALGWVKTTAGTWSAFGPIGESATSAVTTTGSLSAFFPGALSSGWTATTWTPDKPLRVTQLQAQAKTSPSGCGTAASIRITDGIASVSASITSAANVTSGASQSFGAGVPLRVEIATPASGCAVVPADVNVVVTYRMNQ